ETELKEKKHRIEDALSATRAAVEEGIVPGGGTALIQIAAKIGSLGLEGDEATGANIVLRALEEPVKIIAANAGAEGAIVAERVKNEKPGVGYNALTGVYVDMVVSSVIDTTKVAG